MHVRLRVAQFWGQYTYYAPRRGDSIAEVPFGDTRDCLFVSHDRNAVNWTETVEVGGTTLYIGTKRICGVAPNNTST
jgi:hypothetical protein